MSGDVVRWIGFFAVVIPTCSVMLHALYKSWFRRHDELRRAKRLLRWLESRHYSVGMNEYFAFRIEVISLGEVYRKYIGGLPIERKHEIIDKLLQNIEIRTNKKDLVSIITAMHEVEIETLAQIVFEGQQFTEWTHVQQELPNGIILWRLAHPRQELPMPAVLRREPA